MRIDTQKLERRIRMLIGAAEMKNGMTHMELAQYLSYTGGTFKNLISQGNLHKMKVCDLVMIEKLSGEELDRKGLERR